MCYAALIQPLFKMEVEVLQTTKGGVKIAVEGHMYVRKRTLSDGRIRWQCDRQRSYSCSGALTTNGPPLYGGVMGIKEHNHEADRSRAAVVALRTGLKRAAQDVNSGSTTALVGNALVGTPPNIRGQIGTLSSLRRDVQRQRYE